jgi:hypothetical protein
MLAMIPVQKNETAASLRLAAAVGVIVRWAN